MIKKLLLIFWEVVPKYTPDGKMLHEMILVCDAYRKVRQEWVICCTPSIVLPVKGVVITEDFIGLDINLFLFILFYFLKKVANMA